MLPISRCVITGSRATTSSWKFFINSTRALREKKFMLLRTSRRGRRMMAMVTMLGGWGRGQALKEAAAAAVVVVKCVFYLTRKR